MINNYVSLILSLIDNLFISPPELGWRFKGAHGCAEGLKMVYIEILSDSRNYSRTFQGGFLKFHPGIMFLHY